MSYLPGGRVASLYGGSSELRLCVGRIFDGMHADEADEPADWKPFADRVSDRSVFVSMAAYMATATAEGRELDLREFIDSWRTNADVTDEQVRGCGYVARRTAGLAGLDGIPLMNRIDEALFADQLARQAVANEVFIEHVV